MPKVRIEIAVSDGEIKTTIEAIQATARTGQIGDGKIFVLPIERAMQITPPRPATRRCQELTRFGSPLVLNERLVRRADSGRERSVSRE